MIVSMSNEDIANQCYSYYVDQKEYENEQMDEFMEFVKQFGLENYRIIAMELVQLSGVDDQILGHEE